MFVEANGHLINTDELLAVWPVDDILPALKSARTLCRLKFKNGKEMSVAMEQDDYNKLKQKLLEVNE